MARLRRSWIHWCLSPPGEDASGQILAGEGLVRLNAVAAWVWSRIEDVPDRDVLLRRMRRRYGGVEDRRLREDLDRLLDGWLRDGWCEVEADAVFPFPADPWPA
jgi:hypothetical protein